MNDFFAGAEHLMARADSTGKVGCVGFCYGGGVCNALAVAYPELAASVPFYGRQAAAEDVPGLGREDTQVVGIDEAQFLGLGLVPVVEELAQSGRRVLVAGLELE